MDASIPTVTLSDYTRTEMTTCPENSKVDCAKVGGFTDADICAPPTKCLPAAIQFTCHLFQQKSVFITLSSPSISFHT